MTYQIYNFAVIALTTYLITIHDWSLWWLIPMLFILDSGRCYKCRRAYEDIKEAR